MEKIFEIVQASAALDGSSLNEEECSLLLGNGISSAGKTISEQLLCLDLLAGYRKCFSLATDHEYWSVFRLKSIAGLVLRNSVHNAAEPRSENTLQKVCKIANEQRLHISEHRSEEMYRASFEIHYLISENRPWTEGNDRMGRLLMNYLQYECRLEPTVIRPSQQSEYKHILKAATSEEICEIFVSYMLEHRCDAPEKAAAPKREAPVSIKQASVPEREAPLPETEAPAPVELHRKTVHMPPRPAKAAARKSSREQILELLRAHPYMSARDLAEAIGISAKGIEKNIGILKAKGLLVRVGPDKGGRWEVFQG